MTDLRFPPDPWTMDQLRQHNAAGAANGRAGQDDRIEAAFPPVAADFWQEPGKPVEWLVKGWLQAHRVGLFTGKGGSGKTKLAVMLAAAVAAGRGAAWLEGGPPLGRTGPGRVTFASWENTRDEIRLMLCDWPDAGDGNLSDTLPALLGDRLRFRNLAGLGPLWEADAKGLAALGDRLRRDAADSDLLIVDPLAAAYNDNEIARANVRAFMADMTAWATDTQCTVLIVGHPSQANPEYSGSTDWYNAARSVWTLGLADGDTKFECVKVNAAPKPDPLKLDDWKWWRAAPWNASDATREQAIIDHLRKADAALSKRALSKGADGNTDANAVAIERLYEAGRLTRKQKGTGHVYSLAE